MAEDQNRTYQDKFMLRLPDGMRQYIAEQAKGSGRSMNAEIIARLGFTMKIDEERRKAINDIPPPDSEEKPREILPPESQYWRPEGVLPLVGIHKKLNLLGELLREFEVVRIENKGKDVEILIRHRNPAG